MVMSEVMTGTTIIAIKYADGILVGADCRVSAGNYIVNRVISKLAPLSDKIIVCMSGSAADAGIVRDYVKTSLDMYTRLEDGVPMVKKAATLASKIIYENPDLLAGLIVAGYDESARIFSISLGGSLVEQEWAISGSGSAYIYGYCDMNWKAGMSLWEGIAFIKEAVLCAINRDNASGGCIRISSITETGVQKYVYNGNNVLQ
ncbi:beta type-6 subunit of proteasome [Ordospora colligata]|uniref:Proteasome subunit beta n=1 Tax=Ordospora colligata OC4 TaxID=1354746 RepID=A0A0B2UFC1_9MICR|nr:beta type-6 subunit of proteasome [Ordospora colligata OC4]KHN69736.1 beta type-6 subunit of proteasome [Ordospora colligata OC4]TBU15539.1 beta type-6 subunit of proteasome [Ordospora colligata]TBU15702.1 beta type-6 subunit of proteasome [Ordospora colligata]TBU18657.1 beta type-6 subunit of proteasome [Ordospora colligata]